jgi:hypothetical protein
LARQDAEDKNDKFALANLTKHIPKRMKTSQGKVLKLIRPKATASLPPIPKILPLAQRFVRVEISCQIDTVRHDKGEQVSTNAPALKIVQLQRPGYHLDNAFYEELQAKAIAHLKKHSPLLQNVLPGYTATFDPKCMVKYCAQPGLGLHRVWLPLNNQSRQDAPDPAKVKINHPNPSGHAFYVHAHLHIKRDVTPKQPTTSAAPPAPPAAPQPPPTPATGGNSLMAAAMENLRAIANDCRTTPVHITMERLSRLLYSYMRDVDFNTCRDTAVPVMTKPPTAISNNRQGQRRPPRQPSKHSYHQGRYAPY